MICAHIPLLDLLFVAIFSIGLVHASTSQCASLLQVPQHTFKTSPSIVTSELSELEDELSKLEQLRMQHEPQRPIVKDLEPEVGMVKNKLRLTETETQGQGHAGANKSIYDPESAIDQLTGPGTWMDPDVASWMDRTTVWPYVLGVSLAILLLGAITMADETIRSYVTSTEGFIVCLVVVEVFVFYFTGMLQATVLAIQPYIVLIILVGTIFYPCCKFVLTTLMVVLEKLDFLINMLDNFIGVTTKEFVALEEQVGIKEHHDLHDGSLLAGSKKKQAKGWFS